MKKIFTKIEKNVVGHTEGLSFGILIIALMFLALYIYFLFNRPPDSTVKASIKNDIESIDIKFDLETIDSVTKLKRYGAPITTDFPGKNPFTIY